MDFLNNFRKNHSILFCVLFALIYMIFFNLVGRGVHSVLKADSMMKQTVIEIICLIAAVFIMYILKIRNFPQEKGIGFIKGLFTGMFMLCLSLFSCAIGLITSVFSDKVGLMSLLNIIIMAVAVGVCEEFVFRGIIINILKEQYGNSNKGIYITVFTSGIIFGLIHLTNIFAGVSVKGTLIQSICIIAIGSYLGAVYVRCRNIWSMVFLHALNDFASFLIAKATTVQTVATSISSYGFIQFITIPIYLILVFILLRDSKVKQIVGK